MINKFITNIFKHKNTPFKQICALSYKSQKFFSDSNVQGTKKTHGGLKDQDRIFTNVYNDNDPFIEGALKRVYFILK
jgi:hypothetical protein